MARHATGPDRFASTSRSSLAGFPRRKSRTPAASSTGLNRSFSVVAPQPPPPKPGPYRTSRIMNRSPGCSDSIMQSLRSARVGHSLEATHGVGCSVVGALEFRPPVGPLIPRRRIAPGNPAD
ncbi:hypothetical protein L3X38_007857 [Prunus dulcis]|uniref:Uncharacterized protein n=1 Tax=Prunus dulcis TaxID=3755 RepID=A0AAD5F6D5_PRUDU|nr:hypothetical protein L3X38_007857 [Prunus dulcis]